MKTDDGLFICPECGETKARSNTMYYHMKSHAKILDYICEEPGCGRGFIQKSALIQHRLHMHVSTLSDPSTTGDTALSCPLCKHKTAKTKANLIIHIGRVHGAGWLPEADVGKLGTHDCACGKQLLSATAYAYHAVRCYISYAPPEIQKWLGAPSSQPVLSSTCQRREPGPQDTDTVV